MGVCVCGKVILSWLLTPRYNYIGQTIGLKFFFGSIFFRSQKLTANDLLVIRIGLQAFTGVIAS